jgi:PAS domain S-box-containing protein
VPLGHAALPAVQGPMGKPVDSFGAASEDLAALVRAQQLRFEVAIENMSQGLCFFDGAQRLIVSNRRYAELYGLLPERVVPGITLREIIELRLAAGNGPDMTEDAYRAWRDAIAVINEPSDTTVEMKSGRSIFVKHRPMPDGGWVATHEDITDRRRQEAELLAQKSAAERAEALLRDAVDSIAAGLSVFDDQDRLVVFNESNRVLHGTPIEERPGVTFEANLRAAVATGGIAEAVGREEEWIAERLARHRAAAGSIEQRLQDGRWLLISERRMRNGGSTTLRVDITALKEAQAALRESEARLDRAQAIAAIGSWEIDLETGRYEWSKEMYRIRGMAPDFEPSYDRLVETIDPADRGKALAWVDRLKAGEEVAAVDMQIRRPDGEIRIVSTEAKPLFDDTGKVVKIAATQRDVTELRRAEQERKELAAQLQQSQKLEALGTLAGGIAHDLNNTLVPVLALAKLAMRGVPADSPQRRSLELIHQAGGRASDLVKQILAFSRKQPLARCGLRLDEALSDALTMLRPTIPSTISITSDVRPVPKIFADPTQIHQVIINLVINGVQAIGNRPGAIVIALATARPETADVGAVVRLTVSDTGCGMDQATVQRIFEPFYTTKAVGEGSGLGLSMVHGIVASHGGTIGVDSEPGRGSCFTIDFPAHGETSGGEGIEA